MNPATVPSNGFRPLMRTICVYLPLYHENSPTRKVMDSERGLNRIRCSWIRARGCFFREKSRAAVSCNPSSSEQEEKEESPSKNILCKACSGKVTTEKDQFIKNGRGEHCFFNPHGIAFVVSCFRKASGCVVYGEPSTEFTWFTGYAWSLAMCTHCQEHLGWFFQGHGGSSFFGLMVAKLTERG